MTVADVGAQIDRIDASDAGAPRKRITILGAGMAGLVAAYELSRLGHEITLIEAQDRVGGRVWTKRFDNGQYHELGAMRIHEVHHNIFYYIKLFDLKTRPFLSHHDDPDSFYHFRGISAPHSQYKSRLLPSFGLGKKDLALLADGDAPAAALMAVVSKAAEQIKEEPASRKALFGEGPMTDLVARYDRMTLREFWGRQLETNDAVELVGVATGLEMFGDMAATMFMREEIAQEGSKLHEIKGGADLLPTAIFAALRNRGNVKAKLKTEVLAIHNQRGGVQLTLGTPAGGKADRDREIERVDADFVICTLPFSTMRQMVVSGIPADKQRAIRTYGYADSAKVLFSCAERFWETEYNIYGGGSQMDLINRQIYYPSDSSEKVSADAPRQAGMVHFADQIDFSRPKPDAPTKGPGALVGSYVWGADSRRLGSLSEADRAIVVRKCVAEIHPEIIQKDMVLESASIDWSRFRWSAGAFSFMRPGDLRQYAVVTRPEGRLYFAGEHCAMEQGWIEGAVVSALTAVQNIVSRKD